MAGQPTPLRNKDLIRPYQGKSMVNKPWIRPHFWEKGTLGQGESRLTSHKRTIPVG